jgi:hypothetical protein
MVVKKEIFLKLLNSFYEDDIFVDCEIIDVFEDGRGDIIFRAQQKNKEMLGRYTIKTNKYKEFVRKENLDLLLQE